MWGEFEDEEQDKRKVCHQEHSSSESSCAANEIPESTTTKDDIYELPLRNRLVHSLAASNIEVKSQQKHDPDLTYEERKEIIEKVLNEKPGQFLYRFGKYLQQEHLQYFLQYEGDVEVDHFLTEVMKSKNKHTAKIRVRNRRYAALQRMRKSGDFFSEQEMEQRDPLLYDHLIGQHQTQEERDDKYCANTTEIKLSTLLLDHIDNRAHKLRKQKEQEDDMLEEEDSDEDEGEGDGDARMNSVVESREKQMLKEEFYSAGYNAFLRGENKDCDYKEIDDNDALDLLDIQARDEEERYFDEEEVSHPDMDYEEEERS